MEPFPGTEYELRCQSNPAIYTKCGILWMDRWSTDGMRAVPRIVLKSLFEDLQRSSTSAFEDEEKQRQAQQEAEARQEKLTKSLLFLHESVGDQGRTACLTPSFLPPLQKLSCLEPFGAISANISGTQHCSILCYQGLCCRPCPLRSPFTFWVLPGNCGGVPSRSQEIGRGQPCND